jgi:hypothetical protein
MPHPKGGYMAMALMSRTMDDLDEVTGGKRAATYEEVDKYLGHALIAEGLVPFTYTADEAIRWWKAGGYKVLGGAAGTAEPDGTSAPGQSNATITKNDSALTEPSESSGTATSMVPGQDAPPVNAHISTPQPPSVPPRVSAPMPQSQNQGAAAGTEAYRRLIDGNGIQQQFAEQAPGKLLPEAVVPLAFPRVRTTFRTGDEWVIAPKIKSKNVPRLSRKTIVATPAMRTEAEAAISLVDVKVGDFEKMAFGYLMPDGTIQVREVKGKPGSTKDADTYRGHPSGPGIPIFGMHGHIVTRKNGKKGNDGMVDSVSVEEGWGDTHALKQYGIPMATIYNGAIGWHEMIDGQLIFTAPLAAVTQSQAAQLQSNLTSTQEKYLGPKFKKPKQEKH